MSVSLSKGGNVSLTRLAPGLSAVTIGLGWDAHAAVGADIDLDASALACGADGRVPSDAHFVFFNNLTSPDGAIEHSGDSLIRGAERDDEQIDDEQITVDLEALPETIDTIVFAVSIYDALARQQTFGQVAGAFIRVLDRAGGTELVRYDLSQDASRETAMIFGELYRSGEEWKFRAVGQGVVSGLAGIAKEHGVDVG